MKASYTVALIKPDGVRMKIIGHILHIAGIVNLQPVAMKFVTFTETQVELFYAEHVVKPFFPKHSTFMQSGPSLAILFRLDDGPLACGVWRALMGPTDPAQARLEEVEERTAHHRCIRSRWGTHLPHNVVHGSDSDVTVRREAEILGLVPYDSQ